MYIVYSILFEMKFFSVNIILDVFNFVEYNCFMIIIN